MRVSQVLFTFLQGPRKSLYSDFSMCVVLWTWRCVVYKFGPWLVNWVGRPASCLAFPGSCHVILGNRLEIYLSHTIWVVFPSVKRDKIIPTECGVVVVYDTHPAPTIFIFETVSHKV